MVEKIDLGMQIDSLQRFELYKQEKEQHFSSYHNESIFTPENGDSYCTFGALTTHPKPSFRIKSYSHYLLKTQCEFVVDTGIFAAGVYIFVDSSFQSRKFWEWRV